MTVSYTVNEEWVQIANSSAHIQLRTVNGRALIAASDDEPTSDDAAEVFFDTHPRFFYSETKLWAKAVRGTVHLVVTEG
jgi:hypothetical protein